MECFEKEHKRKQISYATTTTRVPIWPSMNELTVLDVDYEDRMPTAFSRLLGTS